MRGEAKKEGGPRLVVVAQGGWPEQRDLEAQVAREDIY